MADYEKLLEQYLGSDLNQDTQKAYLNEKYSQSWPEILKSIRSALSPGGLTTSGYGESVGKAASSWGLGKLSEENEMAKYIMGLRQQAIGTGLSNEQFNKNLSWQQTLANLQRTWANEDTTTNRAWQKYLIWKNKQSSGGFNTLNKVLGYVTPFASGVLSLLGNKKPTTNINYYGSNSLTG